MSFVTLRKQFVTIVIEAETLWKLVLEKKVTVSRKNLYFRSCLSSSSKQERRQEIMKEKSCGGNLGEQSLVFHALQLHKL